MKVQNHRNIIASISEYYRIYQKLYLHKINQVPIFPMMNVVSYIYIQMYGIITSDSTSYVKLTYEGVWSNLSLGKKPILVLFSLF